MTRLIIALVAGAGLFASVAAGQPLGAQAGPQTDLREIQNLLKSDTPLTDVDVARVLQASHQAMDGQKFHGMFLPPNSPENQYDIQMGPAGLPRYLRDTLGSFVRFNDFTGQPGRSCVGELLRGELVIEYNTIHDALNSAIDFAAPAYGWNISSNGGLLKVTSHVRDSHDVLERVFEAFATASDVSIGQEAVIDGRAARPLVKSRSDFPQVQDWLWIDVDSLLVVRWEQHSGLETGFRLVFTHDPSLDMRPERTPDGVELPTCVESGGGMLAVAQPQAPILRAQPQAVPRNIRNLLEGDTELTNVDVARVLQASHAAMDGQKFRGAYLPTTGTPGIQYDVQMGPLGLPRYLRQRGEALTDLSVGFDDFTGQPAHSCAGELLGGELVVEYVTEHDGMNPVDDPALRSDGWVVDGSGGIFKVTTHVRDSRDLLAEVFEPFATARDVRIGQKSVIDGHEARPFMKRHSDDAPLVQDWVWIDVNSLFIVRWEIHSFGAPTTYGMTFTRDPNLDMHPQPVPSGVKVPTCVE